MAYDAVVVGSGPNGLAAAIEIARAGRSVLVLEAADTIGGGTRSAELTEPGFVHDVCSAIHPLLAASPFFSSLPLAELGVRLVHPPAPFAHPLGPDRAVVLYHSLAETAADLGEDGLAYLKLMGPFVSAARYLTGQFLGPLRWPRRPLSFTRFGLAAVRSCRSLLSGRFSGIEAPALLSGASAHSMLPLGAPGSAGFGLFLAALGHSVGWPLVAGGSQRIADALVAEFERLGGDIRVSVPVASLGDIPASRAVVLDLTPRRIVDIAGDSLPKRYMHALGRYRYGPGIFKIDWALSEPIPWEASACGHAATVHIGGTMTEIESSEKQVAEGRHPERPFVILAQQSLFDSSRAPEGNHTAWAYCHVPSGSDRDMTESIEDQIERFAPGFRDVVIARHTRSAQEIETYNPNYVGGDINGGRQDLRQLFTRPVVRLDPYSTPNERIFICSASTPPGGGVHGMCGYFAARSVLRRRLS